MSNVLAEQAALAAERVDEDVVMEMGFVEITSILTQVFAFLSACKNRETPDPSAIQASVQFEHTTNPQRLLRRTARRIRGSADAPMTRPQSYALARASVEQALAMSPETAMACSTAVPNDLVSEDD